MFQFEKKVSFALFGQDVEVYRHVETGAVHWHVPSLHGGTECRIYLNTYADSDKGGLHVLEHMVLCGSKKYPGVDLFAAHRGANFEHGMNAMTGMASTVYQFGSSVKAGFLNTMDIVMDAVLHPELDEAMFYREGIRFERDEEGRYTPSGIVFNEMSEAYQDSETSAYFEMVKAMNVPAIYQMHSGGRPDEIVKLTLAEVKALHAKFYHPSNMTVVTVGDVDHAEIQAYLDVAFSGYQHATRYGDFPQYSIGAGSVTFELNGPAIDSVNVGMYIPLSGVDVKHTYLAQLFHVITQSTIGLPVWMLSLDNDIVFESMSLAQMTGCLDMVYNVTAVAPDDKAVLDTLAQYARYLSGLSQKEWESAWRNHLREDAYRHVMLRTDSRFNDQLASYLVEVLESNNELEDYADEGWREFFMDLQNVVKVLDRIVDNLDNAFIVKDVYRPIEGKPGWADIVSRIHAYVDAYSLKFDRKWDKQIATLHAHQVVHTPILSVDITEIVLNQRKAVPEIKAKHDHYTAAVYTTPELGDFTQLTVQYPVYDLRDESVFRATVLAMLIPRMALKGYSYQETLAMIDQSCISMVTDIRHIPNSKEASLYVEMMFIAENVDIPNVMALVNALTTELDYSSDDYAKSGLQDQLIYRQQSIDEDLSDTLRYALNAQLDVSSLIGYKSHAELIPFLEAQLDRYDGEMFEETAKAIFANKPRIYAYTNAPTDVLHAINAAFKTKPVRSPKHKPNNQIKLPESFFAEVSVGSALGVAPVKTQSVRDEVAVELMTSYISGLAFHLFREKGGAYVGYAGFDTVKRLFTIKSDQDPNMDATLAYIDNKAWLNPEFNAERWDSVKRSLLTMGLRPASSLKIASAQMTRGEWHKYPALSVFEKQHDILSLSYEEALQRFQASLVMSKFISGRTGAL